MSNVDANVRAERWLALDTLGRRGRERPIPRGAVMPENTMGYHFRALHEEATFAPFYPLWRRDRTCLSSTTHRYSLEQLTL